MQFRVIVYTKYGSRFFPLLVARIFPILQPFDKIIRARIAQARFRPKNPNLGLLYTSATPALLEQFDLNPATSLRRTFHGFETLEAAVPLKKNPYYPRNFARACSCLNMTAGRFLVAPTKVDDRIPPQDE